jgi:hypothetical protein
VGVLDLCWNFSTDNYTIDKRMKTIEINGHKIKLYTDIRELPIKRHIEFQKHLLIDSGIGSNMEDVAEHYKKLFGYLSKEHLPEAIAEAQNLYKNVYAVINGQNTKLDTLSCLIHSINEEERSDTTDEGLLATVEMMKETGITWGMIDDELGNLKKN